MDRCKQIKFIIDESDRPEALAYEAGQHIASCADCSQFADERAKLKELLRSAGRVSAPPDFDFKLKARLAEVKARKDSWWLSPAGYLRLGAATAALVIAVVAAQTGGLFSGDKPSEAIVNEVAKTQPSSNPPTIAVAPPSAITRDGAVSNPGTTAPAHFISRNSRRQARPAATPVRGFVAEDRTMVLMRGPAGELEVAVPTVSVGAQSLLYVNSGRQSARSVSTSF
jgi:hypothetical protein